MMTEKSCGNCVNCDKVHVGQPDEFWACDVYGFFHLGAPANCTPPNDHPCEHWSDTKKFNLDRFF